MRAHSPIAKSLHVISHLHKVKYVSKEARVAEEEDADEDEDATAGPPFLGEIEAACLDFAGDRATGFCAGRVLIISRRSSSLSIGIDLCN